MNAKIYEDISGNIHFVAHDGRSLHNVNADHDHGTMLRDLYELQNWFDSYQHNYPECCNILDLDDYGAPLYMACIAETEDGVITLYPDVMGVSGRIYAGLSS